MEKIFALYSKDNKKEYDYLIFLKENILYETKLVESKSKNKTIKELSLLNEYCKIDRNENIKDALFTKSEYFSNRKHLNNNLVLIELSKPGEYYPRIYRPIIKNTESIIFFGGQRNEIENLKKTVHNYPSYNPNDDKIIINGLNTLIILIQRLKEIFKTVYPAKENLITYGQEINNLLILSCIEVENQLKGIFKANETKSKKTYTTNDYIKLKDILKLNEYSVKLSLYPDLNYFSPFEKWGRENPTKSIKWYDNYNIVKHNSGSEYKKGNLESALMAISAVVILFKAQYGDAIPFWNQEIGTFFEVDNKINWEISDCITPPFWDNFVANMNNPWLNLNTKWIEKKYEL